MIEVQADTMMEHCLLVNGTDLLVLAAVVDVVRRVLMFVGGIILLLVITHYPEKYCWQFVENRWPLRIACPSLADLREHLQQHYKRGADKCLMHLDTAMENLNIGLYKYFLVNDHHIFYFIIFKDITPSHPLYDDFCSLIKEKGYTPETGITIRRSRCQQKKSHKVIRNFEKDFENNLTCEIDGVDDAMTLIREAVEVFGESSTQRPLFSIRVTRIMGIADRLLAGDLPTFSWKTWGPGKPARPYQRWHRGPRLWYWGLVYLKELIFGRKKQEDPFSPVAASTETEKTPDDSTTESHENSSDNN